MTFGATRVTARRAPLSSTESGPLCAPSTGTQGATWPLLRHQQSVYILFPSSVFASYGSCAGKLTLERKPERGRRRVSRVWHLRYSYSIRTHPRRRYREGLDAGKAETIQAGFNEGFAAASVKAFLDGQARIRHRLLVLPRPSECEFTVVSFSQCKESRR